MEEQAAYKTNEPRFTRTEVLDELREVIAQKNTRHGFDDLFYHDRLAIELTTDALRNLNAKYFEARKVLTLNHT